METCTGLGSVTILNFVFPFPPSFLCTEAEGNTKLTNFTETLVFWRLFHKQFFFRSSGISYRKAFGHYCFYKLVCLSTSISRGRRLHKVADSACKVRASLSPL